MRIGFWETTPILQECLRRRAAYHPLGNRIVPEQARHGATYDLFLSDRVFLPDPFPFHTEIGLIPGSARGRDGGALLLPREGVFLTGGMRNFDPVTFSSIGDDTAMLCLQQEIFWKGKSVVPFEKKVPFDRDFSLYKNLAASFAFCLAEALFLEDL